MKTTITVAQVIEMTRKGRRQRAGAESNTYSPDRCIHCSGPPHADTVWGNGKPHKYETMALPEGKTCADCVHVDRCCLIFGQLPEDRSCQFWPMRYRPGSVKL